VDATTEVDPTAIASKTANIIANLDITTNGQIMSIGIEDHYLVEGVPTGIIRRLYPQKIGDIPIVCHDAGRFTPTVTKPGGPGVQVSLEEIIDVILDTRRVEICVAVKVSSAVHYDERISTGIRTTPGLELERIARTINGGVST